MNNKESFATKCGKFFANLLIGCFTTCLSAAMVALVIKFIMWLM